jgi:glycerol-3-phosphate O-acyltransferase/dihydroxyacetone phosphate acyltransferase
MSPTITSPPRPKVFQRLIARGARLLARGVYRSVEVDNPEPGWSRQAAILVANHPTGFSDPALLLGLLERSPRFLAKATLWRTLGAGWFLDRLGAIPVYRGTDGATDRNTEMFSAAFEALAAGYLIAIFPEGGVSDRPSIGPIKTGAARLALGARRAGVAGLRIVPIGIHLEDKSGLRSRAFVQVGDVLDLDDELADIVGTNASTSDDRVAVDKLTEEIEARLRAAAPDYDTDADARTLAFAADVSLRTPGAAAVSFADRQMLARRLAHSRQDARAVTAEAALGYEQALGQHNVGDRDVMLTQGGASLRRRLAGLLALLVVLAPFALAGVVMNLVPVVGLTLAMRFSHDAMTAATVRMVAAVCAFLAMWIIWAALAWTVWDWRMGLVAFVAAPIYGAVALFTVDRAIGWWRDWTGRRRAVGLGPGLDEILTLRTSVVAATKRAAA